MKNHTCHSTSNFLVNSEYGCHCLFVLNLYTYVHMQGSMSKMQCTGGLFHMKFNFRRGTLQGTVNNSEQKILQFH
jgi:hypothetical protein